MVDGNVAPAAAAATVDPAVQKLIGTTWTLPDGLELSFTDGKTAKVKGGIVASLAPNGIDASFTHTNGTLEFKAMGQTRTGTWDGEKLTLDGAVATKK